jgi:ABC-type polysaccharide/polyol phosphate export permease
MHFGVTVSDLSNLINIVMRMVFYLSGDFFNIRTRLHGTLQFVVLRVNPSAFLMSEMRKALLENSLPSFEGLAVWFLIGLGLCALGIHLIHKNENSYAKVI